MPLRNFVRTVANVSGYGWYCLPCHNRRSRKSREKVGGSRSYHLTRRYGITAGEADYLLENQGGLCAICGVADATHVDHDHATGAVRQLLCFNCNGGLGQCKDDPAVLRKAAEYVERHRARQAAQAVSRPGTPPVGSKRRPMVVRRTGLCSRGRELLAAREAGDVDEAGA